MTACHEPLPSSNDHLTTAAAVRDYARIEAIIAYLPTQSMFAATDFQQLARHVDLSAAHF